jgi:hypothetical protein
MIRFPKFWEFVSKKGTNRRTPSGLIFHPHKISFQIPYRFILKYFASGIGTVLGSHRGQRKPAGSMGILKTHLEFLLKEAKMGKIAVILSDHFEDITYAEPARALREAGHQLIHVGLEEGQVVQGKNGAEAVKIDAAVGNTSVDHFDALLIPGGDSPCRLRSHEPAVNFASEFMASGKPVWAVYRKG